MARKPKSMSNGEGSPIYAYDIPVHRIKALAAVDPAKTGRIMVLSARRLKELQGLPARKLRQFRLADGRNTFALDGVLGRDSPVAPSIPVEVGAFELDARARAILRGREYAGADLKDAGGAFDIDQVCSVLHGLTKATVRRRVKAGSVIAVPGPGRAKSYPTFQFLPDGKVVDGLRDVQAALPTRNPWVVLNFLTNPQSALSGDTGIARLKAGDLATVVAAARSIGEQGA